MLSSANMRGYIEGYYGRILTWQDRRRLLDQISECGMNCYFYAPKEDPYHRLHWRRKWDAKWNTAFTRFCARARQKKIDVLAGIAPGLDYDFRNETNDFNHLVEKSVYLESAGANAVVLMFDDIEPAPGHFDGLGRTEAQCHAATATRLADKIGIPVFLVPRIYADEIVNSRADTAPARAHYQDLAAALPRTIPIFHCGKRIVAEPNPLRPGDDAVTKAGFKRIIFWDNLYCNDYCPRRLFVGPYSGRTTTPDIMLNGTGMPQTDRLLLALMQAGDDLERWRHALVTAGVPEAFLRLARWFDKPVISGVTPTDLPAPDSADMAAIETLLWQWKSPLAHEWYPFLFGLKHDALIATGMLPTERLAKTQTAPLYHHLRTFL